MEKRRTVALLATYDTTQDGDVELFHIYEGRNYIGRNPDSDIIIHDRNVSGEHLSITYRTAGEKFKFRDNLSSNGTFLNEVLTDEGELNNFDVIRIGSTKLIFIVIPQKI